MTDIRHTRIRRRIYLPTEKPHQVVGELARDVDDILEALWKRIGELEDRVAALEAAP